MEFILKALRVVRGIISRFKQKEFRDRKTFNPEFASEEEVLSMLDEEFFVIPSSEILAGREAHKKQK